MKRKIISLTLCAVLFALGLSAEAQQPTKIARIGVFFATTQRPQPICSRLSGKDWRPWPSRRKNFRLGDSLREGKANDFRSSHGS